MALGQQTATTLAQDHATPGATHEFQVQSALDIGESRHYGTRGLAVPGSRDMIGGHGSDEQQGEACRGDGR